MMRFSKAVANGSVRSSEIKPTSRNLAKYPPMLPHERFKLCTPQPPLSPPMPDEGLTELPFRERS